MSMSTTTSERLTDCHETSHKLYATRSHPNNIIHNFVQSFTASWMHELFKTVE